MLWCRTSSGHGCVIGSHSFLWDVITHPYPDFRQTSVEVLRYGRVIASVIHYACNCLSIPTSVWVRISNFSMWRGVSLRSWGPWSNTGIHLMKQFAHYWYLPCCHGSKLSWLLHTKWYLSIPTSVWVRTSNFSMCTLTDIDKHLNYIRLNKEQELKKIDLYGRLRLYAMGVIISLWCTVPQPCHSGNLHNCYWSALCVLRKCTVWSTCTQCIAH